MEILKNWNSVVKEMDSIEYNYLIHNIFNVFTLPVIWGTGIYSMLCLFFSLGDLNSLYTAYEAVGYKACKFAVIYFILDIIWVYIDGSFLAFIHSTFTKHTLAMHHLFSMGLCILPAFLATDQYTQHFKLFVACFGTLELNTWLIMVKRVIKTLKINYAKYQSKLPKKQQKYNKLNNKKIAEKSQFHMLSVAIDPIFHFSFIFTRLVGPVMCNLYLFYTMFICDEKQYYQTVWNYGSLIMMGIVTAFQIRMTIDKYCKKHDLKILDKKDVAL